MLNRSERDNMEFVKKAWGHELLVCNTPDYCGKVLKLKEGYQCSMHYHKIKDETFLVTEGVVRLQIGVAVRTLYPNDVVRVRRFVNHQFTGLTDATIIEFSSHHDDDDSYRITKSGKVKK